MSDEPDCLLRIKLVTSLLSGKPLKLKNIRRDADEPGLKGRVKFRAI
jgi:RNA 3'-terminal phosphate cyclase